MSTIVIDVRQNYGKEAIYPANQAAEALALIAGTKTLTRRVLRYAVDLGCDIKANVPVFNLDDEA